MSLTVKSATFTEGHPIPTAHGEDGEDRSPELSWSTPPPGTVEFALLVDDPDAPTPEPWVHWIIAKIPASAEHLHAGYHERDLPDGAPSGIVQGKNSWGTVGYRGPAPPPGHGVHHYHFKLFALDAALDIPSGIEKHDLLERLSGHVLARGELVGTFERS